MLEARQSTNKHILTEGVSSNDLAGGEHSNTGSDKTSRCSPMPYTRKQNRQKSDHLRLVRWLMDKDTGHQVEDLILAPGLMW